MAQNSNTTNPARIGTLVEGNAQPGDLVSYTDVANPPMTFLVTGTYLCRFGDEFRLLGADLETITSQINGRGWTFVN